MRRTIVVVALCLTGCAALERDFSDTPTADLCAGYMNLPSYNLWHQAREKELYSRNESCGPAAAVAAVRAQTDQTYGAILQNTIAPPTPVVAAPQTHSYLLNGTRTTCTTNGAHTVCR